MISSMALTSPPTSAREAITLDDIYPSPTGLCTSRESSTVIGSPPIKHTRTLSSLFDTQKTHSRASSTCKAPSPNLPAANTHSPPAPPLATAPVVSSDSSASVIGVQATEETNSDRVDPAQTCSTLPAEESSASGAGRSISESPMLLNREDVAPLVRRVDTPPTTIPPTAVSAQKEVVPPLPVRKKRTRDAYEGPGEQPVEEGQRPKRRLSHDQDAGAPSSATRDRSPAPTFTTLPVAHKNDVRGADVRIETESATVDVPPIPLKEEEGEVDELANDDDVKMMEEGELPEVNEPPAVPATVLSAPTSPSPPSAGGATARRPTNSTPTSPNGLPSPPAVKLNPGKGKDLAPSALEPVSPMRRQPVSTAALVTPWGSKRQLATAPSASVAGPRKLGLKHWNLLYVESGEKWACRPCR